MHTPKGAVRSFSNPHQAPARALIVPNLDVGAQYFRDDREIVNVGGPPDREKLLVVMCRYGLVPAPAAQPPL
ncbi:hypothetical protein [Burkholderia stagnalis]|uniref:hypothetical protein n=1 Tax=Burkholderia stagnalis TaxID=1503054 RepID=UPI001E3652FC|nr:hypothetical protein [Burkholderia stagnalis]